MGILILHERTDSPIRFDVEIQRLSSRWIEVIHAHQDISANEELEELQTLVDALIDSRATDHAGVSSMLLAALATAEISVGRDHVLTQLLSSIVENQRPLPGCELSYESRRHWLGDSPRSSWCGQEASTHVQPRDG